VVRYHTLSPAEDSRPTEHAGPSGESLRAGFWRSASLVHTSSKRSCLPTATARCSVCSVTPTVAKSSQLTFASISEFFGILRLSMRLTISACFMVLLAWPLPAANLPVQRTQEITPAPVGPFHVVGSRVMDSKGRPFLMRGTQLTEFRPQTVVRDNRAGADFGPHSATSLTAIRLRFNMNTVRLPMKVLDSAQPGYFSELAKVVRRANQAELLVILAALEPDAGLPSGRTSEFWSRCAAYFKDYPNVMFDVFSEPLPSAIPPNIGDLRGGLRPVDAHSAVGWNVWRNSMQDLVHAIRSTGAAQPIVAMSWKDDQLFEGAAASLIDDPNVIYEASPRYATTRTDEERDAHFGFIARSAPVLVSDWDLKLDDPSECSAIPSDPSAASALVQASLDYFDEHQISWTVSTFAPGKLVGDLSVDDATTLDNGWTCGGLEKQKSGLGRLIQAHMRATGVRGLFVVSPAGGLDLSRGGIAVAYGPVMAERDSHSLGPRLPLTLGRIAVQVTDALGVTRPAGLLWAAAGWGQVNFVIPADSANGPARMNIVRQDGSSASANIFIAETAPGFWTGISCRGPAVGSATQVFADGRTSTSELASCTWGDCHTLAVPVTHGATTRVRLRSGGFRNAGSAAKIEVTIGGIRVPVISFGPEGDPGVDQVTIEIPDRLRALGETDLIARVNGRVSNAVRIRIGGVKPVS
jgi:uncharacterized protein (TIGR03437 family)